MKRSRCGLSKNLLQMKFMQRKKGSTLGKNEFNEEFVQHQELLELCQKEGDKFLATNSFIFCENLQYGRMSFKGMNPEVEQLMRIKNSQYDHDSENNNNEDNNDEADISDKEMLKFFKKRKSL